MIINSVTIIVTSLYIQMGCKSTKDSNQEQLESIQYDFITVGVERYDTLWLEVFNNLRHLEKIRLEIKLLIVNL